MAIRTAVIYYSATGSTYELAREVVRGAEEAGAEVRLRKVHELAPQQAIESNPKWAEYVRATADVPEASVDDLEWANALIFGTPTRFGNVSAQLKEFMDMAGPLWARGALIDKVVSGFVTVGTRHGGHESTLLALYNTMYHWGAIVVPPGYTSPVLFQTGNPYGASFTSENGTADPSDLDRASARYLGARTVDVAQRLSTGTRAMGGEQAAQTRTREIGEIADEVSASS